MGRFVALALLAGLLLASAPATASGPDAGGEAAARARDLFRRGVVRFKADDVEGALDLFQQSRALTPNRANTFNAAVACQRLGRHDEALDLYEETLARFGPELDEDERARIVALVAGLGKNLAALDVSANVAGVVVVDGRERARLPRTTSLKLMPGHHRVRVLQDGYATFEAEVDLAPGRRSALDARLTPLAAAGGLRVEPSPAGGDGRALVDGVDVGAAPWEGTLAPGPHVVQVVGAERGSVPRQAVVLQGQTTLVRLVIEPLGRTVVVRARPPSASVFIDDVLVGRGAWEGRLPSRRHAIAVREEGYVPRTVDVAPLPNGGLRPRVDVSLDPDPRHPRWGAPARPVGTLRLDALVAVALAPTLHSGAERGCLRPCDAGGPAVGPSVGLRVAYELRDGPSFELAGQYLGLDRTLHRREGDAFPRDTRAHAVTFDVTDALRLRGFLLQGQASLRVPVGAAVALRSRVGAGVMIARSADVMTATATTSVDSVPAVATGPSDEVISVPFAATTELGIEGAFGPFRWGAAVAALFLPTARGPALPNGDLVPRPAPFAGCTPAAPAAAACAGATAVVAHESAYGPLFALMPQISAMMAF